MVPLTVVPGGTVTGTLTEPVPVLAMLTTPLVSLAVTRSRGGRGNGRPGRLVGEDVADAAQGQLHVGRVGVEVAVVLRDQRVEHLVERPVTVGCWPRWRRGRSWRGQDARVRRGAHDVGLVDVAHLGVVGEQVLHHPRDDLVDDLGEVNGVVEHVVTEVVWHWESGASAS